MTFGALTVTLVRRTSSTTDRHNNPVWVDGDTEDLEGCFLQQQTTDEVRDARDSTITTWILFAPAPTGPAITARDRIRIAAPAAHVEPDPGETFATFEHDGNPDVLDHIDGTTHHLELILWRARL